MGTVAINGVDLYVQTLGEGLPLVFVTGFGSDHHTWDPQVRYFSRWYSTVAYNNRGYAPSTVPVEGDDYSLGILGDDLLGVLDHLDIEAAHLVGQSMGAGLVRSFALHHPERCRSIVLSGSQGGGPRQDTVGDARFSVEATIDMIRQQGMEAWADAAMASPIHRTLKAKDPKSWEDHRNLLAGLSPEFVVLHQRNIRGASRDAHARAEELASLSVPTLVVVGDGDEPALEPALFMKRTVPGAALAVFPRCGHSVPTEEAALFNATIGVFLDAVESQRAWA